jgi:hypothetical protein
MRGERKVRAKVEKRPMRHIWQERIEKRHWVVRCRRRGCNAIKSAGVRDRSCLPKTVVRRTKWRA